MTAAEEKYILTLDIGTTTIRSIIYNSRAEIVGKSANQVVIHYPNPGYVEIDPDQLLSSVVEVVNKSIHNACLTAGQITAMGISTQRSTFITWSKSTGKPFHRFITWKDMRADKLVKQWNESYIWRTIKAGAYVLYLVLRNKRFKAGSVLKFMNTQTTLRFCWALQNVEALKTAVQNNDAVFGTLDTWLLYKLTAGKIHMSDVSSASATGFFDPFTMQWASWAMTLFGIPFAALPPVVDTVGDHFTSTELWGQPIPIRCCMADQTASMWGSCCFEPGDVKLTLGTGTFFNIHTGARPLASVCGLYPVVGWRAAADLAFVAEGANSDTGSILTWARELGLFDNPSDTASIAMSVPDSDGVYFIPAFSGLGPPYNDGTAAAGFVGMKPSTSKAHLVRAVLESLAFRTAQLYECVCSETNYDFNTIRLDGGVSNNDFVAQLIADLTGLKAERPEHVEMSSLGCAHIVGLHLGIWKSKEELKSLRRVERVFTPNPIVKKLYEPRIAKWEDAVKRMCGWYSDSRKSSATITDSSNSEIPQTSFKTNRVKNNAKK